MRVRSSVLAAAAVGLAVAVGVSACGSVQQLSAKDSVSKAMSSYQHARSAKFVVSLDTTVADIDALNQAEGEGPLSAGNRATLTEVLAGNVTFAVQAPDGKTFGDSGKAYQGLSTDPSAIAKDPQAYADALKHSGAVDLTVNYQGAGLAEARMVNGVVYAKADGPSILRLAGEPQSKLHGGLQGLPPSLAPIAKAAHNQWVSIDLVSTLPSLLKGLTGSGLPAPTASVNPATIQSLLTALKSAYQKNVTITKVGSSGKGTDYRLSAPIKQIANAVEPQLESLAGQVGDTATIGGDGVSPNDKLRSGIAKLPNKSFDADVWVRDDELTWLSLDLAQFDAKAAGHKVVLNVDITTNQGSVSAPSGATPVDVKALVQDVQSQAGDFSSGSGTDFGGVGAGGQLDVKALKQAGFSDAEIKRLQKEEKEFNSGT